MLFGTGLHTTPASAAAGSNILFTHERLQPGEKLVSDGGRYHLVMQGDGNLVIFANGTPIWATGTNGRSGAWLGMQGDGNLVMYHNGVAVWATGTNPNSDVRLVMQTDGNLVLYTPEGRALWCSKCGAGAGTVGAIQPVNGTVTGYLYYRCGSGADSNHYGIDIGTGTSNPPVVTTAAGKVKFVGWAGGAGKLVEIQHGNGYVSRYFHLHNFAAGLAVGQVKAKGALIGYAGNTGDSRGNHLHFEIRKNGSPVNFSSAYRCGQRITQGTSINYNFPGI